MEKFKEKAKEWYNNIHKFFTDSDYEQNVISIYGNNVVSSPNLDALSKKSVQFNNAHCQYPHCGPSRSSIMSRTSMEKTSEVELFWSSMN